MSKLTKRDRIINWLNRGFTAKEIVKKGFSVGQVYKLAKEYPKKHESNVEPVVNEKAKAWKEKNEWFGVDEAKTARALAYHERLIKLGVDPNSDEYYELVDKHMRPKARMQPSREAYAGQKDLINSPEHYTAGGIETIDFIEAKEVNYHVGNAIKYLSRAKHKGDYLENIKKAQWYINREVSRHEKDA